MIDERDRFERAFELFPMPEPSFDRLVRRRDRKHRNRRIGAATLALAVAAAGVTGALKAFTRSERQRPAEPRISPLPIPSPMHNGPFTLFGLVSWGITQVDQEGGPATRLVRCESHCTTIPSAAWTADGTRIAFIAECEGGCASAGDPYHGIRVLDVRTAHDTLIVPGDDFEALDWSPDGTRIVYATRPEGRVFVMNADGSGRLPLPPALNNVVSLSWSPDGTSILYVTSGQQMFLYSFVSSRSVPLGSGRNPDWSPDGTRIAYADLPGCEVWVMASDGSDRIGVRDLTQGGSTECAPLNGLLFAEGPVWSPDGKELVLLADRGSRGHHLLVMHADGSDLRTIPVNSAEGAGIAWRPVP